MYLIDTNVWLERLLDRERSEEVGQFLAQVNSELLYITDFGFHSVAVVLARLKQADLLEAFVQDTFIDGDSVLVRLEPDETRDILKVMEQERLDFDDAYQYVAAENYNLILVSLDHDFDRTKRGRRTPVQLLADLQSEDE